MKFKSKEEAIKYHLDNYHTDHIHKVELDPRLRGFHRIEFILQAVPENSTVLDVGVNGGGNALLLEKHNNAKIKGIDIMPDLVRKAEQRGIFAYVGEAEDLSRFKDASFDAVLCSEVLEHLFDPMPAIKEAMRVLKPGGLYVVTFPHPLAIRGGEGDFHQKTYNQQDIKNMFDEFTDVGVYEIISSEYYAKTRGIVNRVPQWWGITAKKEGGEENVVKQTNSKSSGKRATKRKRKKR